MSLPLLQIVALEPERLAQLFLYLNDHLQDNGRGGTPLFQPQARALSRFPPAKAAIFTNGLNTPLGQPGWRRVWIALDGVGNIAGHADLRARPEASSTHRTLLGMGVHRDYRRCGLGRQLVDTTLAWASLTPPLEWVDLDVLSVNLAARRLYERAGFVVTGEVPDMYRIDDDSHSSVMMSRRVS